MSDSEDSDSEESVLSESEGSSRMSVQEEERRLRLVIPAACENCKSCVDKAVRAKEGERLRTTKHKLFSTLPAIKFTLEEAIPGLCEGCMIYIYSDTTIQPFEHKKFWISLQDSNQMMWNLYFDHLKNKMKLEASFVQSKQNYTEATDVVETGQIYPEDGKKPEDSTEITTEILKRIEEVLPATNFSYCLRNDEHVARYIMYGNWISNQMMCKEPMREYFKDILEHKDTCMTASPPSDLKGEETPDKSDPLFEGVEMVKYVEVLPEKGLKLSDKTFNILIIGPTGVGKSSLTNLLFNQNVVKSKKSPAAVTRNFQVVNGTMACQKGKSVFVNVVDTMGLCDQFVENEFAVKDLQKTVLTEDSIIDRVVVVMAGQISPQHKKVIQDILNLLKYEKNKDHFFFFYNKTEKVDEDKKDEMLTGIGSQLGVDVGHQIQVSVPDKDGDMAPKLYCAGQSTACGDHVLSKKQIKDIKNFLLPHHTGELRSSKRMKILAH